MNSVLRRGCRQTIHTILSAPALRRKDGPGRFVCRVTMPQELARNLLTVRALKTPCPGCAERIRLQRFVRLLESHLLVSPAQPPTTADLSRKAVRRPRSRLGNIGPRGERPYANLDHSWPAHRRRRGRGFRLLAGTARPRGSAGRQACCRDANTRTSCGSAAG